MLPGWRILTCLSACYFRHYRSLARPVGPASGGRMLCRIILLLLVAVIGSGFQRTTIAGDGKSCRVFRMLSFESSQSCVLFATDHFADLLICRGINALLFACLCYIYNLVLPGVLSVIASLLRAMAWPFTVVSFRIRSHLLHQPSVHLSPPWRLFTSVCPLRTPIQSSPRPKTTFPVLFLTLTFLRIPV